MLKRSLVLFAATLSLSVPLYAASNRITVTEKSEVATDNYPMQLGRPFVSGEIANYPQAIVDGTPVLTQADVKQRWPDGSVKHAILSFLIPRLEASQTVVITFQNQSTGNNTALSQSDMLDNFDFDAAIELTNGSTVRASARTMLAAGAFQYWMQGPVATSIVLADHSSDRLYDIGFADGHRSFRPIFHATFWPTINKVHLRYIGEVSNTEVLQDVTYSLALKLGKASPQTVYTQASILHTAGSRWTKDFWIGGAPGKVAIDHNLAYLAETTFVPNYDTSKHVSEAAIAASYSQWLASDRKLYGAGNWQRQMPMVGGRPDIGPYPEWVVRWLYTGDPRLQEQVFGNADLAGAWAMHFREGNPSKFLDRARRVAGLGKVFSISTRPTIFMFDGNNYLNGTSTRAEDRFGIVGPMTLNGWMHDPAHQPDPYSVMYTLTGDYWALEQMLFWAGWNAANPNPGNGALGRGPTGAEGGVNGQTRGQAWTLRTRTQTAFLCPDDMPEKAYFERLIQDAIEIAEGVCDIHGTPSEPTANWQWGRTYGALKYRNREAPVMHFWEDNRTLIGNDALYEGSGLDPAIVGGFTSPWMTYFLIYSFGRGRELGYRFDNLLAWAGQLLIGTLTDPAYDPYRVAAYWLPVSYRDSGAYFATWAELDRCFYRPPKYDARKRFENNLNDPVHGYSLIALTATSMLADQPNGPEAWQWISSRALGSPVLNDDPKWAILPRHIGAFGTSAVARAPRVRVYPNPWRSDGTRSDITFAPLTANCEIKIFTLSGHHVRTLHPTGASTTWDLRNESGQKVASGIYLFTVTMDNASLQRGKFAVIH